jgi:hypothetical protein
MNLETLHTESYLLLPTVKKILGYKDIRSVMVWCETNGVYVLRQGNRQVVNTCEFILSFYTPFINHLKGKHSNWKELFLRYLEGDIKGLLPDTSPPLHFEKRIQSSKKSDSSFITLLKNL